MTINLLQDRGVPLDRQTVSWKDMVGKPISKLDDDAFTRIRAILMNGVELDSLRTKQVALRMNADARRLHREDRFNRRDQGGRTDRGRDRGR